MNELDKSKKEKKSPKKSPKKSTKKEKQQSPQSLVFSNRSISNLSRGLGPNDWIRLAYALGFLPQVRKFISFSCFVNHAQIKKPTAINIINTESSNKPKHVK